MRKTIIDRAMRKFTTILLALAIMSSFAGCSSGSLLVGEYEGTSGSFLKLNKDGTCIYAEDDSTGTGTGTWYVEDGKIYIKVSNLNYVIYGDISDVKEGILLESTAGSWSDEYFMKSN